jgi:hypothetical protein
LLIAACASSPSPEDDLNALNARVETTCKPLQSWSDATPTADCLNAALETKTVALALGDYWEPNESECIDYFSFFAADGEVRMFDTVRDCEDTDATTVEEQTCPGPFSAASIGNPIELQATGCTLVIGG